MVLLKDDELVQLVIGANPIVVGIPLPPPLPTTVGGITPDPWFGPDSAIQPSSIDLRIGAILLPGMKDGKPGSVTQPKNRICFEIRPYSNRHNPGEFCDCQITLLPHAFPPRISLSVDC